MQSVVPPDTAAVPCMAPGSWGRCTATAPASQAPQTQPGWPPQSQSQSRCMRCLQQSSGGLRHLRPPGLTAGGCRCSLLPAPGGPGCLCCAPAGSRPTFIALMPAFCGHVLYGPICISQQAHAGLCCLQYHRVCLETGVSDPDTAMKCLLTSGCILPSSTSCVPKVETDRGSCQPSLAAKA